MTHSKTSDGLEILKKLRTSKLDLETLYQKRLQELRLAEKIRQARKQAGMTQSELAKRIHSSQSVVARFERSNFNRFSMTTLVKIAAALGRNLYIELKP